MGFLNETKMQSKRSPKGQRQSDGDSEKIPGLPGYQGRQMYDDSVYNDSVGMSHLPPMYKNSMAGRLAQAIAPSEHGSNFFQDNRYFTRDALVGQSTSETIDDRLYFDDESSMDSYLAQSSTGGTGYPTQGSKSGEEIGDITLSQILSMPREQRKEIFQVLVQAVDLHPGANPDSQEAPLAGYVQALEEAQAMEQVQAMKQLQKQGVRENRHSNRAPAMVNPQLASQFPASEAPGLRRAGARPANGQTQDYLMDQRIPNDGWQGPYSMRQREPPQQAKHPHESIEQHPTESTEEALGELRDFLHQLLQPSPHYEDGQNTASAPQAKPPYVKTSATGPIRSHEQNEASDHCFDEGYFEQSNPQSASRQEKQRRKEGASKKTDLTWKYSQYKGPITTLMIRNIPLRITQQQVIQALDERGFAGKYDFFYMPSGVKMESGPETSEDPEKQGISTSNLGYAFINLPNTAEAMAFQQSFHNFKFDSNGSNKRCAIYPAHIQGLENNVKHFRFTAVKLSSNKPFIRDSTEQSTRPRAKKAAQPPYLNQENYGQPPGLSQVSRAQHGNGRHGMVDSQSSQHDTMDPMDGNGNFSDTTIGMEGMSSQSTMSTVDPVLLDYQRGHQAGSKKMMKKYNTNFKDTLQLPSPDLIDLDNVFMSV